MREALKLKPMSGMDFGGKARRRAAGTVAASLHGRKDDSRSVLPRGFWAVTLSLLGR